MKPTIKIISRILIATTISVPCLSVQASEISFTPRASLSISSYKFSQTPRIGALAPTGINDDNFPEVSFDVTFKILGIGGTFVKDGYYLDLSAQKSAKEEDSFTFEEASFTETFKGDRQDLAITFGKKILDNRAGIYLGYKTGKSEASGDRGQHLSFEEKGPFIGANYGWRVSKAGVLTFNIAFADLKGDLTEDVTAAEFAPISEGGILDNPLDINASSDAQGVSYGIGWAARVTDNLSYSISIDSRDYTFDNVKDNNPATITSDEFKEKLTSATVAVYFQY